MQIGYAPVLVKEAMHEALRGDVHITIRLLVYETEDHLQVRSDSHTC